MNLVFLIIIVLYAGVFLCFALGFSLLPPSKEYSGKYPSVSILIAARNEENHILSCLRSISKQDFKGDFKIVLIDDASSDCTIQLAKDFFESSDLSYQIIKNESQLGKKQSLQKGIAATQADIIITRDADTLTTNRDWLKTLVDGLLVNNVAMVVAPLTIKTDKSLFSVFEWVENAVLTVVSGGSNYFGKPFLASGANLAFTRKAFNEINGYSSHIHLASGDDVFLLRDLKAAGKKVTYIKNNVATITTYSVSNLSDLLRQKIRWSAKVFKAPGSMAVLLAFLVLTGNLLWIFSLVALFIDPLNPVHLTVVGVKFMTDSFLIFTAARFFNKLNMLWLVFPMSLLYPFYSLFVAVGALFIKPRWK